MSKQMKDVDHTHPHTDSAFGNAFTRGPAVAADGGEPSDARRTSSEPRSDGGQADADETTETMADVDHESTDEGVDRAYERGTEGRDEIV